MNRLDVAKYDQLQAQLQLMSELAAGRKSGDNEGWISSKDLKKSLQRSYECKLPLHTALAVQSGNR